MMALADILTARADNARATAPVDCGALGTLTLEALPLRELERLSRGADAERALFYAACRDLQRAGAELLRAGKVYRPDQITALVSDAEAKRAADAVRALSGYQGGQVPHEGEMSEIRPEGVQENPEVRQETVQDMQGGGQIRLDTVRQTMTQFGEIRPASVQTGALAEQDGQASREFLPGAEKEQISWQEGGERPQNVVVGDRPSGISPLFARETKEKSVSDKGTVRAALHENTSELVQETAHSAHESKSEFQRGGAFGLHETESEYAEILHEITSEKAKNLHENESESAEILHENESELAERVARALLDGLRRAAWVR